MQGTKTSVIVLSLAKPFLDYGHAVYTSILFMHSFKQWSLQTELEPSEQEKRKENLRQKSKSKRPHVKTF